MYHRFFGLKEEPFSIAVNPRYLFMSDRHRDALAHLLYGVGFGGGFILLTGEVGTGKTTINRSLLEQLPETTDIALILNPALNAVELLAAVCDELGIAYQSGEQSLKTLTDKLHQFLLANYTRGRNTVLLIDEAQHLQFEVLEQIRLLTNLETNTKKLLQIILVGQPELRTLLNKPELRQLAQRITARYQLKPLNVEETAAYIRHRLQVAGLPANQTLFPPAIIKGIYQVSRGIPRIINVLCDRMLLGCYGQNKTLVDRAMLKQAVREVMGEEEDLAIAAPRSLAPLYVVLVLGLLLTGLGWQWPTLSAKLQQPPAVVKAAPLTTPPIAVEPANDTTIDSPMPNPWLKNHASALQALAEQLNVISIDCNNQTASYRCETINVDTWQDLKTYNRPAVLTLISPSKIKQYAALIGLDDEQATLLKDKQSHSMALSELGPLWTGEATFIWQAVEGYSGPVSRGNQGPFIQWLASQFALLDGQSTGLAEQQFTEQLEQRVKIFQRSHNLQADGVVGLKTLLAIHDQLGATITLQPRPHTDGEG